jgi:hypothetical protein
MIVDLPVLKQPFVVMMIKKDQYGSDKWHISQLTVEI